MGRRCDLASGCSHLFHGDRRAGAGAPEPADLTISSFLAGKGYAGCVTEPMWRRIRMLRRCSYGLGGQPAPLDAAIVPCCIFHARLWGHWLSRWPTDTFYLDVSQGLDKHRKTKSGDRLQRNTIFLAPGERGYARQRSRDMHPSTPEALLRRRRAIYDHGDALRVRCAPVSTRAGIECLAARIRHAPGGCLHYVRHRCLSPTALTMRIPGCRSARYRPGSGMYVVARQYGIRREPDHDMPPCSPSSKVQQLRSCVALSI
jgi:hypothetical protein